jgi:alpha-N-arabinofuranosidase
MDSGSLVADPTAPASGVGRDDFDGSELGLQYNFLRNPRAEDWSLSERSGALSLACSAVTLNDVDSPAFVGRRQQHFAARFSTRLDFRPETGGEEAGLVARMNETHHYEIAVGLSEGRPSVFVRRTIGSLSAVVAAAPAPDGALCLCIRAERDQYQFAFGPDEGSLTTLARGETRYLSTETAGGFTGVYLGMYATGGGTRTPRRAHFEYADYTVLD